MLKLVHIKNISESDTPSFTTQTEQENYFDNSAGITITDGWYPPYYENEIKFETNQVSFDSNYNYLILYYNSRRYYYFIDDMSYVNEGVISIHITMDTIQTFMFGATLTDICIERKFINRWTNNNNDYEINRNYIRENLTNASFKQYSYNEYTSRNPATWFIVGKFDKVDRHQTSLTTSEVQIFTADGTLRNVPLSQVSPYNYKFCPYYNYRIKVGDETKTISGGNFIVTASYLENTIDIYLCPFNPLRGITINDFDLEYDATYDVLKLDYEGMQTADIYYLNRNAGINSIYHSVEKRFSFSRNDSQFVQFNKDYAPVLLDDNYMRIEFGSRAFNVNYPLYMLTKSSLYLNYAFNAFDGTRFYSITKEQYNAYDEYTTTIVDMNVMTFDLKSSKWSEYIANNKNRWISMQLDSVANITSSYIGGSSSSRSITNDISSRHYDKKTYRYKRNKSGRRRPLISSKSYLDDNTSRVRTTENISEGTNSALGSAIESFNEVTQEYAKVNNYLYAPMSAKQLGSANGDSLGLAYVIYDRVSIVEDIEQIAQYYHRNGYLVNEYVKYELPLSSLLNNNNTRAYYNIIKLSMCSVHLNTLEAQDIIEDIERRLQNGFRYWNLSSRISIGTFQYDNVEKEYLQ